MLSAVGTSSQSCAYWILGPFSSYVDKTILTFDHSLLLLAHILNRPLRFYLGTRVFDRVATEGEKESKCADFLYRIFRLSDYLQIIISALLFIN